jgi:hypothetical protein
MYNNSYLRTIIVRNNEHVGIDKLRLTTRQFSVSDVTGLNIYQAPKLAGQKLTDEPEHAPLFRCQNEPVFGSKATLNTDTFSLDIGTYGLLVGFNPSKITHSYELLSDAKAVSDITLQIERELKDIGVNVSLFDANVSRLDLAKQSMMPRIVSHYAPAFDTMRLKGVKSNRVNYGAETFSMRNNQTEICFYDKLKELNPEIMPSNLMRCEARYRKTAAVQRYVGTKTLNDLLKIKHDGWLNAYESYMLKRVFVSHPEQLAFDFAKLDALIKHLITETENTKGHIKKVAAIYGTQKIFDEIGVDRFLNSFAPYVNERTLRRYKLELNHLARYSVFVGKPVSTLTLIDELKTAFIK